MKTNNKISAYILRGSTGALLFSCVIVALSSAINLAEQPLKVLSPQDNAAFGANAHQSRSLSFADRVAYQRAIEDVYWRHRIWPNTNAGPKPSLDAVMSQAEIEKKVQDYLGNSQALEDYWQRPITADQLQAETERMASHSKQPDVLRELFEALGNDPSVIAECLARPVLSERMIADVSAQHETGRFESLRTTELRTVSIATILRQVAYTLPVIASPSGGCTDDTWTPTTLTNAPSARFYHTAVWTGSEMIVWGGGDVNSSFNSGGRYNPSTDSWTATSTTNAPSARQGHTAVWTGSEMIVWGGYNGGFLNTGGRYNPSTDSWTATSTTNAPAARGYHTAVWTGSEMIVWGGYDGTNVLNTGGRYSPATDSWTATSTTNAPARFRHRAVWSDSEMIMIVWGGQDSTLNYTNTGGRYNPSANTWTATSTTNAPDARAGHTAVWIGTGSEMIVWGGYADIGGFNTGGRYEPGTDSWTATSTTNAPTTRDAHTAVWTGSEMIVWGGNGVSGVVNTGGRYNPSTDSWTATSTTNAPEPRADAGGVWTGSEMIVWGGSVWPTPVNTGGRYCAAVAGPTPTPTPGPITLSAAGRKVGGINTVRLTWSGATSTNIDVYRDGMPIVRTANDGRYIDSTGDTGRARYTYRVCEAGTSTCSNSARVRFQQ
jgi:N-acetylneuraminic acid mutarotase